MAGPGGARGKHSTVQSVRAGDVVPKDPTRLKLPHPPGTKSLRGFLHFSFPS